MIVLRHKEPEVERPYRVWGYPVTPMLFCAACAFLAYSAVVYKPWVALSALGILLAGLPLFWISARGQRRKPRSDNPTMAN